MNVSELLEATINRKASDLHLSVGLPPYLRVTTRLMPIEGYAPLTTEDVNLFLSKVLSEEQKSILEVNKEVDFSIALGTKSRFRVNAYYQKGYPSVALRVISMDIPTLDDLHLPEIIKKLCGIKQGLILVAGPTGHGKSTTIASMIDHINSTRAEHILTIEDPIEYIFTNKKSIIQQREMYLDTHSWESSLRSALRQDPNIVFVGEMRDVETIDATLSIAETGHMVFATLHTNSASQSIDRIVSAFESNKQSQVRLQLSSVLEAVISQRLLTTKQDSVMPALELMLASDAVRSLIREGKAFQLDNVISTSSAQGMIALEASMALLVKKGLVEVDEAMKFAFDPELLRRYLKNA